jgi:hypothetical protein
MLRPLVLNGDHNPGGEVGDPHSAVPREPGVSLFSVGRRAAGSLKSSAGISRGSFKFKRGFKRGSRLSVQLTCCPPAPLDRYVSMRRSASLITTSTSSGCGMTATEAVLVCTRPCFSVVGTCAAPHVSRDDELERAATSCDDERRAPRRATSSAAPPPLTHRTPHSTPSSSCVS